MHSRNAKKSETFSFLMKVIKSRCYKKDMNYQLTETTASC